MVNHFLKNLYFSKSRTFFAAMCAFVFGIAAHSFFGTKIFSGEYIVFLILLASLGAPIIFWDKKVFRFWGLLALFFFFGFWRFDASIPPQNGSQIGFYNGREAVLTGIVMSVPETAVNKTRFTLGARSLDLPSPLLRKEGGARMGLMRGNILVTLPGEENLKYGDLVRLQCGLAMPKSDGEFDYAGYLSRFGIYSTCSFVAGLEVVGKNYGNPVLSAIYKLREAANRKIDELLLPPASSFLAWLITGERASMPESLRSDFLRSGTMHIIAISGWNITMVLALFGQTLLFFGMRRRSAFVASIFVVIFYIFLTGAGASVVRAGAMGLLPLFAAQVGRQNNPRNVVTLAAALMLLQNPRLVAFDMGFLLSFAAILGLFYISPVIKKYFEFVPKFFAFRENLVATIAATIATSPLILYMNGNFSFVAIPANVLVLPFVPLAMGLGSLAVAAGFIWFWFGEIFAWLAQAVLGYVMFVLHMLAAPKFAAIQIGKINLAAVVIIYASIVAAFWRLKEHNKSAIPAKAGIQKK